MGKLVRRNIKRIKLRRKSNKKSTKTRRNSKLKDWSIAVRTRDGFKCKSCGSGRNTHAHHLVSKYYHPKYAYVLNNCITLCKNCHIGKGGVHHKRSTPKNSLIKKLREIYNKSDFRTARVLVDRLTRPKKKRI